MFIRGINYLSRRDLYFFFEGEGGGGGGKEKESIEDVAKRVQKEMDLDDEGKEKSPAKKEKDGKEDKEEDKEDKEDDKEDDEDEDEDLDETQVDQAKKLFKVLNNPATARDALLLLVKSAGIDIKDATKEEKKEVKKTIKDIVKSKLGQKYEFLSEDLGDVLQDVFDEAVKEAKGNQKEIEEKMTERERKETRKEVSTAYEKTVGLYTEVPDKVLKEVLRIQKEGELILGPKTDPAKYFRSCFIMAAENLGVTLTKKSASSQKTDASTTKTRSAFARLSHRDAGTQHKDGKQSSQVKSLDDIIADAAAKVEEKMSSR